MRQFIFLLFVLLVASCARKEFETPGGNEGGNASNPLVGDIETPTFDYRMGGVVELKIFDTETDATYTVFTFNNDHKEFKDIEVTDPDTDELLKFSAELPKTGCLGELGTITSEGKNSLTLPLDVSNDIDELIVRKKDAYGTSFEVVPLSTARPIERTVNFQAHRSSSSFKSTQADDFSVLWGLNGDGDLFTIDLQADLSEVPDYPTDYDSENPLGSFKPTGEQLYELTKNKIYTVKDAEPEDQTIEKLEDGSWTIAMDDGNNGFYTLGKDKVFKNGQNVYPMYYYKLDNMEDGNGVIHTPADVNDKAHTIVGYLPFTAPRLEYSEGFLYLSTNRKVIKMIPRENGELLILDEVPISGLTDNRGGDIVRTDPPNSNTPAEWYMSTFGGLYALTWEENYGVVAQRRSAANLPYTPTSIAYSKHGDSNTAGQIWVADNYNYSSIYAMDKKLGSFQRRYHIDMRCNDLTCANGGTDFEYEDAYPGDSRYYEINFPSKYGWGTIAFEDMYPLMQDYDFNDVVLDFKYEVWYTKNATPWGIKLHFKVRNVTGANFRNGFGFVFEDLKPDMIKNVSYDNDSNTKTDKNGDPVFTRDDTGLEAGHPANDDAVFILFDDHYNYQFGDNEIEVEIRFDTDAVERIDFYNGFDPFIFVDGHRELEIHMPDKPETSKGHTHAFLDFHGIDVHQDLDDHDPVDPKDPDHDIMNIDQDYRGYQIHDGNYYSGFPWVLVMPHRFNYPKEEVPITTAYPKFRDWANLSQAIDDYDHDSETIERYEDWYSNKPGYQNPGWIIYD